MSSIHASRWRSVSSDAILWREWNSEFVVRNERSGNTHLLGLLAGRVLQVLVEADGDLGVGEIALRLGERWPGELGSRAADSPDRRAAIAEVLSEFRRLGLAECEAR